MKIAGQRRATVHSALTHAKSARRALNVSKCAAYYLAYLPVMLKQLVSTRGFRLPDTLNFAITWLNISSAAVNGLLYIALHSSVRSELRRYLPRCGHSSVAPTLRQPVGDGGAQRYLGSADTGDTGTRHHVDAPVSVMTSSRQHGTGRLSTAYV